MEMKKLLQLVLVGVVSLVLLMPVVYAADGGLVPESAKDPASVNIKDVRQTVVNVINWLLGFAAIAATGFLIFGGYMWMSSAGNAERIEDGKKIIIGAIIGLLMIILAAVVVNTIIGVFGK